MSDDNRRDGSKKRERFGAPPPTGLEARKNSGKLCTATRRNGTPCANFAILGAPVCRVHGGNLPAVRKAAQVRLLRSADLLMAELLDIAMNKKLPVQHRLVAIRDGLDRANLAGTHNIEVTVEKGKTFEDFAVETLIDVAEDDAFDVVDAEVIEDDHTPLRPRDPSEVYEGNRHDRALEDGLARARRAEGRRPGGMSDVERRRRESAALAEQDAADAAHDLAERNREHEATLLAKANGTYNPSSRGEAMREAARTTDTGKRRARTSEATISDGKPSRRRRD